MTQIAFTGRKISEKLDNKIIRNGGFTITNVPTVECSLASEHDTLRIEVGGYIAGINYNKHREKQHYKKKRQNKNRENNRYVKNISARLCGLTFPEVPELKGLIGVARRMKKS